MKKLICFLIMVVAVSVVSFNATIKASSVTNKGSTVVMMNTITMPTAGFAIEMTARMTADDWVQQNSSSNLMPLQPGTTAVMNNTSKLMGNAYVSRSFNLMMAKTSLMMGPAEISIMGTGAEVTKIFNFDTMVLNSSNASMSTTEMTQWRNLDATNNNSTGLTSTLVALKIWPTSVDNNVAAVNIGRSTQFNSDNMSSSLNFVQVKT